MKKVQRIAGHIHQLLPTGAAIDRRDLVQDGMIGWLDAKRLFDPRKGTSLLAFAGRRISGAIRDGLRSRDDCSRSTRVRIKQIRAATWKLSQQLGRDPTSEETAAAVNMPLPALYAALNMAHAATPISLSFSLPADTDGDETIADIIADEHGPDAFELVAQLEHKKLLHDAFRKLNAQERQAVWLYYLDENQYTLEEVGQFMGLGAPRISQICSEARKKLAAELCKHQEFASLWNPANRTGSMRPVHPRHRSRLSTTGTEAEFRSTTPGAPCKSRTSSGGVSRRYANAAD
jgi:RNA polymerase sigma factor for flagellar operon FliA